MKANKWSLLHYAERTIIILGRLEIDLYEKEWFSCFFFMSNRKLKPSPAGAWMQTNFGLIFNILLSLICFLVKILHGKTNRTIKIDWTTIIRRKVRRNFMLAVLIAVVLIIKCVSCFSSDETSWDFEHFWNLAIDWLSASYRWLVTSWWQNLRPVGDGGDLPTAPTNH